VVPEAQVTFASRALGRCGFLTRMATSHQLPRDYPEFGRKGDKPVDRVTVFLHGDETKYKAQVVGSDKWTDLPSLRSTREPLPSPNW